MPNFDKFNPELTIILWKLFCIVIYMLEWSNILIHVCFLQQDAGGMSALI